MGVYSTIAAISTPPGAGGIGIIRLSGPDSFAIAEKHFRPSGFDCMFKKIPNKYAAYGHISGESLDEPLDEAIVIKMQGPKSYTAEDIVEFQCHGGRTVLSALLTSLLKSGAIPAQPGEFTKRAFLNGRIDLIQAEAVMDIISSRTNEAARNALFQMDGHYSDRIRQINRPLIQTLAEIEAVLDYPEHDVEEEAKTDALGVVENAVSLARAFTDSFKKGRLLKEGASVVLAGPPNAGKSSLMNRMAGKYKAIVTDIPGTTRDILEEHINLSGIPVRLVDTAGLRQSGDIIENIGIEMANKEIMLADVVVYLIDATVDNEDYSCYSEIFDIPEEKLIIAINKADTGNVIIKKGLPAGAAVKIISALTGQGIDELVEQIAILLKKDGANGYDIKEDMLMSNIRHLNLMQNAISALENCIVAIKSGMTLDCIAIDIREAINSIIEITGEYVSEEIEHEIFSKFCIGK